MKSVHLRTFIVLGTALLVHAANPGEDTPQALVKAAERQLTESATRDFEQILESVRKAADQNYPPAQTLLATLYSAGIGEPRESGETPQQLYLKSAQNGDSEAMEELARRYRTGYATRRDYLEGSRWVVNAALAGNKEISRHLDANGRALSSASPELEQFNRVVAAYHSAIVLNDADALLRLAKMYEDPGEAGASNLVRAYACYVLAGTKEGSSAQTRAAELQRSLTAQQREEAAALIERLQGISRLRR